MPRVLCLIFLCFPEEIRSVALRNSGTGPPLPPGHRTERSHPWPWGQAPALSAAAGRRSAALLELQEVWRGGEGGGESVIDVDFFQLWSLLRWENGTHEQAAKKGFLWSRIKLSCGRLQISEFASSLSHLPLTKDR